MTTEEIRGWFAGRLPEGLFEELVEVTVDREEITVVGRIPVPEMPSHLPANFGVRAGFWQAFFAPTAALVSVSGRVRRIRPWVR